MTYDAKTSDEVLWFLAFAVRMCQEHRHLKEFFDDNKDVILQLTDEDKETLRQVYREMYEKFRKAA